MDELIWKPLRIVNNMSVLHLHLSYAYPVLEGTVERVWVTSCVIHNDSLNCRMPWPV